MATKKYIYYRVKLQYDGYKRADGGELVRSELYTQKEIERLNIPIKYLDKVEENKADIYWFFGARFGSVGYNNQLTLG